VGAAQGDGSRAGWRAAFPTDRNLRHDRSGYLSGCGLVDELGVVALAGALAWQLRSIMKSDTPRLRAVETVAIGLPFLLLFYASLYALLSFNQPASFTQKLGRTDALYFTMTVFSTIGFGDIAPVTEAARIVTMTQWSPGSSQSASWRDCWWGGEAGGRTDQRGDRARGGQSRHRSA
jgi:hypothetical protein